MRHLNPILAFVVALYLIGCSKTAETDAAQSLETSFKDSNPETQQAIGAISASLKQGQYVEATRTLAPLVQRPLTDVQRHAVGLTLQQINQQIARNPTLDTKEMYELREKMFKAIHSGPRF